MQTRASVGVCLALVVGVAAVYGQVLGHEFLAWDDDHYVTRNVRVLQGLSGESVVWALGSLAAKNWHPLTWLSHMLDVQIFGPNAGAHLAVNAGLHAAAAVLLFLALRALSGSLWRSAFVAAIFALHPTHVESVAWVSERKDLLSGLFFALTLLAYAGYARRPGVVRYLLVFLALALGLLAKPMLVTVPLVLLLLDVWPLGRWQRSRALALVGEKVPLLLLSGFASWMTLLAQSRGALASIDALPLSARLGNASITYVAYLWKTLWPANLSFFYPHPALVSEGALLVPALASALVLGIVTAAIAIFGRRRPYLGVGWLWYLGMLVPVIGLVQVGVQSMADRYTYLPLIGIYVIAAWGARDWLAQFPSARPLAAIAAALAIAVCAGLAFRQAATWRDSATVFEHGMAVTENNYVAYHHLGLLAVDDGRLDEARGYHERALEIYPRYAPAQVGLGTVLVRKGNLPLAIEAFQRAILQSPYSAEAHNNLGAVFAQQGDLERAEKRFDYALELRPDYGKPHVNLGGIYVARGEFEPAAAAYEQAIRLGTDPLAEAHAALGGVYIRLDRLKDAEAQIKQAIRLRPGDFRSRYNLGVVFESRGELAKARTQYGEALRIQPGFAAARQRLSQLED